jgi:hypothetical protein
MDQSRICGVGNVYRAEVLHLLGIHPNMPGASIPSVTVRAMWRLIVGLLRRGVEEKRIVTTRGLVLAKPRERVPRYDSTHVYRRRTCRTCQGSVLTYMLRARVVHFCSTCQPLVAPTEDADSAAALCEALDPGPSGRARPISWDGGDAALRGAALVVQATSAALSAPDAFGELDLSACAHRAVALDMVYRPTDTAFLRAARGHGLETRPKRDAKARGQSARHTQSNHGIWTHRHGSRPCPRPACF